MKEITITVPDGKRAEWINGVLTLVDEPQVDNRPVTERIKTFEDACNELGEDNPLVKEYWGVRKNLGLYFTQDLSAYLKLRIIVAALNEGWEPKFEEGEGRYYPWFTLYTKCEYDELDEEEKGHVVYRGSHYASAVGGVSYAGAFSGASLSQAFVGLRLAFRTNELSAYAGMQFIEEWADFMFKPYTTEL